MCPLSTRKCVAPTMGLSPTPACGIPLLSENCPEAVCSESASLRSRGVWIGTKFASDMLKAVSSLPLLTTHALRGCQCSSHVSCDRTSPPSAKAETDLAMAVIPAIESR